MNCKGDDVKTRPHRMAQILSVPEKTGIVTPEQLETAASWKTVSNSETIPRREVSDFYLDSWISRFCPELGQPQVWTDGRKWVFPGECEIRTIGMLYAILRSKSKKTPDF